MSIEVLPGFDMPDERINKAWIPFWVDKWIFGSTRLELKPDERSVWLDLLALASKNDGFIRANEETSYPKEQLAGLLVISIELLERTINKCLQNDKIAILKNGTMKITNWEKYSLSKRHRRRFEQKKEKNQKKENNNKIKYNKRKEKNGSKKTDIMSSFADINVEFIEITNVEYDKLIKKYGENNVKKMIEKLDNYKGATGKKYKSDYRAILNWVAEEILRNQKQSKFDAAKEALKKEKEAQSG